MSTTATVPKPRFKKGDIVKIANTKAVGHCRTPWYLRGKPGTVVEVQGTFHDPARLAYHKPGWPAQVLYKVRFLQTEIWPDYVGPLSDHLEADIYEPWLTPVTQEKRR
ncbi:MAG: SH3-like domain-containing protein [Hyphomicrobiaceae bacterium]